MMVMLLHLKISVSLKYLSNFWRSLEMPLINCEVGIENLKISVSLKYLSNFWRSLEMPLINCEVGIELSLKWIESYVFATYTKL